MNHIHRLRAERDEAREALDTVRSELNQILAYLATDKFRWPHGDYVHVRTDILPKLQRALLATL